MACTCLQKVAARLPVVLRSFSRSGISPFLQISRGDSRRIPTGTGECPDDTRPLQPIGRYAVRSGSRFLRVRPDDTAHLPGLTKAIYGGTGDDITLRSSEVAGDIVFCNVPDGAILPIRVLAVRSSGTGAADIVGLA